MIKKRTPIRLAVSAFLWALALSVNHTHGQDIELYAPLSVSASDGDYADKIGITWDAVRNATQYRVYRSSIDSFGTATQIGTTARGYYFDEDDAFETTAGSYYYWIQAENDFGFGPESLSDHGYSVVPQFNPDRRIPQLAPPPEPPENPITAAKAFLGKTLFWEEQMSATSTMACGTCHQPAAGGNDQRALVGLLSATHPGNDGEFGTRDDIIGSAGVPLNLEDGSYDFSEFFGLQPQVTNRKAKDMIDSAYGLEMAWDGRISETFVDPVTNATVIADDAALEAQVVLPPINTAEMAHVGMTWPHIIAKLEASTPLALSPQIPESLELWIGGRSYPELFDEVFGDPEITATRVAFAVATYERTLFGDRTAFDRVNSGIMDDHEGVKDLGRRVFEQSRCDNCHTNEDNNDRDFRGLLADNDFHYIGVRPQDQDPGRFTVTGNNNDRGRIKTPNLRNVGLRKAFMMDGAFESLDEVVDFYNRGGDFDAPNKDNDIRRLGLNNNERQALVAFMREDFTDPRVRDELPPFDRPMLYTESVARTPTISGGGVDGASGDAPLLTAIEPPLLGNPNFTVGVSESLAGAEAVLVTDTSDPGQGPSIPETAAIAHETIELAGSGSEGWGSATIEFPDDASLVGQTLYGRWYVVDPNAAGGVAVSPVFTLSPFGAGEETPSVTGESRLYNLSVRANLVSGRNLITGFVVSGGERMVMVRAAGPAMDAFGLDGFEDPQVALYNGGEMIASNDDWTSAEGDYFEALGAFEYEDGSSDAALMHPVEGLRTAIVPAGTETGVVLVEAYDAEDGMDTKLINLSARYHVGTGDDVLIAGFTIVGTGTKRLLIRAVGPQLEDFDVPDVLSDPVLEIYNSDGVRIAGNDDWAVGLADTFEQVGAFALDTGSADAALSITLAADATYTAIVRGADGGTGEALVEVYEIE